MELLKESTSERILLAISLKVNNKTKISKEINVPYKTSHKYVESLIEEKYIIKIKYKDLVNKYGKIHIIKNHIGRSSDFIELTNKGELIKQEFIKLRELLK